MRVLAIDHGEARCGCAISDPTGTLVRPLPVIEPCEAREVADLVAEHEVEVVVVGLPVSLGGEEGAQAERARQFCTELSNVVDVPIHPYDERFTTRLAQRSRADGATAAEDSLAAAHLLESYLAARNPAGEAGIARIVAIAAIVLAFVMTASAFALWQPMKGDGEGKVVVKVPQGATGGEIASILDERGVVSNGTLFKVRLALAGKLSDIKAGSHELAEGMSYSAAIEKLTEEPAVRTITVTIPEGLSRAEIAPIAKKAGLKGNYVKATSKSKVLSPSRYGAKDPRGLEGFLFPATYELKPGATVGTLVRKQLRAFEKQIAEVDMKRARAKNLNVYDVLTIAAMVEREVQVAKERPLVAAVIYNRLKDGQPLGIDATIRYAVDNWDEPLKQSELATDSPYNTRRNAGLPPGPIGSPGIEAIKAAAKPAKVDYLYYVVKPGTCGEHEFASTDAEFQRAVQRYNRARERAGGRSPTKC